MTRARYAPPRWVPAWHRYHLHGVPHWHPHYWATGIFIYSPPPPRARVVVVEDVRGQRVESAVRPTRAVDRNGDFGIMLTGGSYMSGYEDGGGYGDMGLGVSFQFRPVEAVGLQLDWSHHSQSWDEASERVHEPTQLSAVLYAFPWTRVSPFVEAGVTWTARDVLDTYEGRTGIETVAATDTLFGPHGGLGVEFAIGESAALRFSMDAVATLDRAEGDPTAPVALVGKMGLGFYF